MDYQKNLKYFKSTDTHFYIGLALLILGVAMFTVAYIFWVYLFWYQDYIGIALAIVGAIVAFAPRSMRSNEKDLDAAVNAMTDGYEKETAAKYGISARDLAPVLIGDYTYGEPALIRRGKDDRKYRSNTYSAAALLFSTNGICVVRKDFSLTEEKTEESVSEFRYADLESARVETEDHRFPDGHQTALTNLVLYMEGKPSLSLPAKANIKLDQLCDDINTRIRRAHAK